MNILPTEGQEEEPDYLIMKPACPKESHDVKRKGEIENCFKFGHTNCMFGVHGVNFYEDAFARVSSSLAASSKPDYHPGSKEALQYKDEGQNTNQAIFLFKLRHTVTIAFIFIFIITG